MNKKLMLELEEKIKEGDMLIKEIKIIESLFLSLFSYYISKAQEKYEEDSLQCKNGFKE